MDILIVGAGLVGAAAAAYLLGKKSGTPTQGRPEIRRVSPPNDQRLDQARPVSSTGTSIRAKLPVVPTALATFRLVRYEDLAPSQRDSLLQKLRRIRRPPGALHKLVSPEFLVNASSAEISDLMMSEPQLTAKILATVNSPLYGLPRPLGSIGQAATFLGTNTVRSLCLQYLLDESLKADSPDVQKVFDRVWDASACASHLCFKLAQLLGLPEPGVLATQVLLSYLGQLAGYALLPPEAAIALANQGALERGVAEQDLLGLTSVELGSLLLTEWALPPSIVDAVRQIGLVGLMPFQSQAATQSGRWGLGYLCVRLGEQLAAGTLTDLAGFDLDSQDSADFYSLPAYLDQPELHRLREFLRFPEVVSSTHQMTQAMRLRR